MKKIFLTSALAITIACPAMAETTAPDIAAGATSATCDSGTLNTTDGTSTLSAQWTANTITLKFYSDDTTTPFATNTCTYDGGITLPASAPRRTGYNFAGWQVKQALINLANYFIEDEESQTWAGKSITPGAYCEGLDNGDWYGMDEGQDCNDTRFSDLNNGEWTVKYSNGTVKGIARCSTQHPATFWYNNDNIFTSDHFASSLADETGQSGAQYCWCQATSYDVGNSGSFANVSSPSWVFAYGSGNADYCASDCANGCAHNVQVDSDFRSAVFGVSGN